MNRNERDSATFITGCARSGTTLMAALLDNHPDLLVFPEECMYLRATGKRIGENGCILRLLLKDGVIVRLQGKANYMDIIMDERRDYDCLPYDYFEELANNHFRALKEREGSSVPLPAIALMSLIYGYQRAVGRESYSRWVIKNPNYELHWRRLFADFPGAKMIFMMRDPREVILSRTIKRRKKRYLKQGGDPAIWRPESVRLRPPILFLGMWERSVSEFSGIKRAFPAQILLVRYENLVSAPRDVMGEVSSFLDIPWDDNLLTPSFLGTGWKGNSMHQRKFMGVESSNGKKRHNLAAHHLWQIEAWLGDVMLKEPAVYAPSGILERMDVKAFLSRLDGERLLGYLRNRLRMLSNWCAKRRVSP